MHHPSRRPNPEQSKVNLSVSQPRSCALLALAGNNWFLDLVVACQAWDCATLSRGSLSLPGHMNPYQLREDDRVEVVFVDTRWYKWLAGFGRETLAAVFRRMEAVSDLIVGVEGYDTFRLGAPPDMLDRCSGLLKAQGLYRDRDLYNYEVGPYFPGALWTEKSRPSQRRYSPTQLEKLHRSLPCFVGVEPKVRAGVRQIRPATPPMAQALGDRVETTADSLSARLLWAGGLRSKKEAFLLGSLTHIQRRDLVVSLNEANVNGTVAITGVPEFIFGVNAKGTTPLSASERERLSRELRERGLLARRRHRLLMMHQLRRHAFAFGVCGYGELTFRHAEAWQAKTALICQDVSHADTMFPMVDGDNVRFCRPDLGDALDRIRDLQADPAERERLAERGHKRWRQWVHNPDEILRQGLVEPVERLLAGR